MRRDVKDFRSILWDKYPIVQQMNICATSIMQDICLQDITLCNRGLLWDKYPIVQQMNICATGI